jgi:CRP-like cAMP-binding protein
MARTSSETAVSAPKALSLSSSPVFKLLEGLPNRDRELVLAAATLRRVSANTAITRQGTPAVSLYMVVRGCARFFYDTSDGRKILLIWLAPGDLFGGAAMIAQPVNYLVSTEAVKDCELLVWDRAVIRGFAGRFPQITENALSIAAEYLGWSLTAHVALSCHTARERLARVLIGLARAIGKKVPDGIEIDVTNEELANAAQITPYTTSRVMSSWQRNRAVMKRRGKVVLCSPDRLLMRIV